jgi:hypothetical protein
MKKRKENNEKDKRFRRPSSIGPTAELVAG